MITTRNLIILTVVLAVLAGVSYMQKNQHREATSGSSTDVVASGEFNLENTGRISMGFGKQGDAVVLASTADGWVIESHHGAKANEQRITTLLRNFSNLAGEFRSDNGEVLKQYGLSDDQAVTLRAEDLSGNEVLALNLGHTPKGFPGQFMRNPGSNKVYLSQTGVLSHLGIYSGPEAPKYQFFLELQAVKEVALNLDGFTIRDGDSTMAFSKKFGVIAPAEGAPEGTLSSPDRNTWEWLAEGAVAADLAKTKIDGVLNSAASIRANDVAAPTTSLAEYGLESPTRSLALLRQDGSEVVMEFGLTREAVGGVSAGTYMSLKDHPAIWVVTEYTMTNIFKSRDDLKAE